ncbi:MAG: hypothetical protein RL145_2246, partial [Pseudomonadota bacterium]
MAFSIDQDPRKGRRILDQYRQCLFVASVIDLSWNFGCDDFISI